MTSKKAKALVLAGFGINCDYETTYALELAGADTDRLHINRVIEACDKGAGLEPYHILAVPGGFAWADDHGAGVLLATKLRSHIGREIEKFIESGKLVIGICNGFQALVNMGLLPGFSGDYRTRSVAISANDCGNFRNQWIHLTVNGDSPCVFTRNMESIDLPVRHGEGKFHAPPDIIERLIQSGQVVMRYAVPAFEKKTRGYPPDFSEPEYQPAEGRFPENPNGSLYDIAGICDQTGRIFGLMPHPEAFHHLSNHPDWTRILDKSKRWERPLPDWEGAGLRLFRNAVGFVEEHLL